MSRRGGGPAPDPLVEAGLHARSPRPPQTIRPQATQNKGCARWRRLLKTTTERTGCQLRAAALPLWILMIACSGCAITYIDAQGAKTVLGLVKLTIQPSAPSEQTIGESVHVQSIGLAVYSTPLNRGIAVGYNRETVTAVRSQLPVGIGHIRATSAEAEDNQ